MMPGLNTFSDKNPPWSLSELDANFSYLVSLLGSYAPLNSPALTGSPTGPTASPGDNSVLLSTTAFVAAAIAAGPAAVSIPVRQTILSGPLNANGTANFGGTVGASSVTASATLVATAANGFGLAGAVNLVGSIGNPSWTGFTGTGNIGLYLIVNSGGTCSPGITNTVAATASPWVYQSGGTPSSAAGVPTFNTHEMKGYLGNGSSAPQTAWVAVGEVAVTSGNTTGITWYQPNGYYDIGYTATLPNVATTVTHNIGVPPDVRLMASCTTANAGYAVGDEIDLSINTAGVGAPSPATVWRTRNATGFIKGGAGSGLAWAVQDKASGNNTGLTLADWSWKVVCRRPW